MDCKTERSEDSENDHVQDTEDEVHFSNPSVVSAAAGIMSEYTDYVEEMNSFITSRVHVSNSNAIELNDKLRNMLILLRGKLEVLRDKCASRYEANAEELNRSKKKSTHLRGRFASYTTCGQPYFKNRNFYKAPINEDYRHRKYQLRELFPIDLDYTYGHWTIHDKTTLIFGIKEQLIDHLELSKIESRNSLRTLRLADLYKQGAPVISSFRINWNKLVLQNLKERHTVSETISMWNEYLHPHLRRGPWTSVEDTRLMHAAKMYNFQNWTEIAKMVSNRSKLQCMVHCHCVLFEKMQSKNIRWTKEEDEQLLSLVKKYSMGKYIPWTKVTEMLPNRTKIQVYHRYIYSLKPEINHGRFTPEEDCILLAAIQQYGKNYADIPNDILPGRTQSQIRQRYNNVLKHSGKIKFWTIDDDKRLMELVKMHGTSNWVEISRELSNHTRISCRTRYTVIKEYLAKNKNATIEHVPRKKRNTFSKINEGNWLETLIKLKNGTSLTEDKPVTKYLPGFYTKLNTIQRLYFDFFKYSYNFVYDANPYQNFAMDFIQKNSILYSKFLGFDIMSVCHMEANDIFKPVETVAINFISQSLCKFQHVLEEKNTSMVPPPTWNSLLLYRNLMTFDYRCDQPIKHENGMVQKQEPYVAEEHPALAQFKKRLAILLYYPYLLSKLKTSDYVQTMPPQFVGGGTSTMGDGNNSSNAFIIEYISDERENSSKRICDREDNDDEDNNMSRKKIKK